MSRKEKKYHFIYKTTDTRNGNFYIGMHSTNNLNDGYVGSGYRLKKLIYKYGKDIFDMEILEFLPNRKLLKKREFEIVNSDLLNEKKCMNLRVGGEGGFKDNEHKLKFINAGKENIKLSKSKREYILNEKRKDDVWLRNVNEKVSKSLKKRYETNEGTFKNKKHSDETKKKIGEKNSLKQKGSANSQYNTRWITNGIESKKIKKEDPIPDGWKLGRVIKT